jgi:rRNA biogenesis protein RRP5
MKNLKNRLNFTTTKNSSRKQETKTINDSENSSDEEEEEIKKKQTQNLKKKEKKITEDSIVQRENELLKKTKPETETDYERLIIESPNSSYLWIQYMSFKLYLTDIDGAREIGKRALKKINFKEDDEKFNIYSALMNLENKFGDEKSQQKVLNDALLYCNKKRVYIQQAQIFAKSENEEV